MKKIDRYILTLVLALFLVGCNDDFLERYPTASISPPTFFQTENDFIAYTNLFYSYLPGGSGIYGETADNIVKSSIDPELSGTHHRLEMELVGIAEYQFHAQQRKCEELQGRRHPR